ncbi:hypothetical protein [Polycladidibacter hongkongensis]|uniref:hypothetical protein n=1 Tax=Polycladidibacter hongkongensis TaxID=1647556 RepID=UPI000832F4EC|nr:hypothetical protein [Pseudovibrio hongkongensis]
MPFHVSKSNSLPLQQPALPKTETSGQRTAGEIILARTPAAGHKRPAGPEDQQHLEKRLRREPPNTASDLAPVQNVFSQSAGPSSSFTIARSTPGYNSVDPLLENGKLKRYFDPNLKNALNSLRDANNGEAGIREASLWLIDTEVEVEGKWTTVQTSVPQKMRAPADIDKSHLFNSSFSPNHWMFEDHYRHASTGLEFYGSDVIRFQYEQATKTPGSQIRHGDLPRKIEVATIINERTIEVLDHALRQGDTQQELISKFLTQTQNGKLIGRVMDDFGLQATAFKNDPINLAAHYKNSFQNNDSVILSVEPKPRTQDLHSTSNEVLFFTD